MAGSVLLSIGRIQIEFFNRRPRLPACLFHASVDVDGQPLLGELVRHGEALELLPVGAMVEYKESYDHTWFGPDVACGRARAAATRLRGLLRGGGRPVGPADAHAMPIAAEKDTDAAIAIARISRRQLQHPLEHARVLHRLRPW
jgi:hypothetical protein